MRAQNHVTWLALNIRAYQRQQDCQQVAESHVTQKPEGAMSVLPSVPHRQSGLSLAESQTTYPFQPVSTCRKHEQQRMHYEHEKAQQCIFPAYCSRCALGCLVICRNWGVGLSQHKVLDRQTERDLGSGSNGSRLTVSKWTVLN